MSIMEAMPPGFRFYPTEDELVSFYLNNKLDNNTRLDLLRDIDRVIPVLEIYSFNPSDLPKYSGELCEEDPEQWFFFIPRQESEARGGRPNRLTTTGYWKATGSPGYVYSKNRVIGLKRTMVFYRGRAPRGKKTEWKMNEYKAIAPASSNGAAPKVRQELSLCRVYNTTKCLRAFDRRPLGVAQGDEPTAQQAVGGGGDDVTRLHDGNIGPVVVANSPETSSSSGNHGGQYPAAETAEDSFLNQMEIEDESLWNWDQVNWFSGL